MESPVAHKLLKQIAAFSTDVDNLAREVHTLRKTGNPQHLPTIKDVTQRLITQLLAFSAQLTGAKGTTPQHQHVVALIRDSEYSSLHFLAYLHNLVAHTRTIISHTSHQDVTVNFDWKYIQDLLNKLRKLCGSLNTRTRRAQCKIPESASSSPYSLTATRDRGQMCGYVPQVESRSYTQSPWSRTADGLTSAAGFKVELHDSPGTHALDCKDVTHHHFQPSSSYQQKYNDCTIHKIESDLGLKPAQIFELYRVWSMLFCLPAIPTLVLYYALFPSDIALGAPVSRLEGNSLERLIEALGQHMAHYTGGLFQINMPGQGETDSTQRLHNTGRDALVVRPVDEAVAAFLDSRHHQDAIQGLTNAQGFDVLKQLASAFLMIMKTADPYKSDTVQRHLMYLAHTLRYATHLPDHEVQLYLDAIANTMSYHQAAVPNRQLPWYIAPQPLQSLHLKPELRIFSDIRTFAAKEGLRRLPHQDPPIDEPRRRFAITANALSSWSSCMRPCHPLKLFEPCLERKKAVMTYLLINLTPPESIVCGYSLWTEAVRLCNTGTVAEPAELLAIFLAASERPDLLWNQILGPAAGMGSRSERILNVLRDKIGDAVAPDLLVCLIAQIEQRHVINGHH